jgi:CheY-like chemotaxis protein
MGLAYRRRPYTLAALLPVGRRVRAGRLRTSFVGRRHGGEGSMPGSGAAITILMADDDPDDRVMTRDAFRECRLANPLQFAVDGEELMDYLHHRGRFTDSARYPLPGLILLDLNMPKKDGREALREIKADPALSSIPVVVLSTSSAEEDIARSYIDGANSFITKPVTFEGLREVVNTLGKYWLEIVDMPPAADAGA